MDPKSGAIARFENKQDAKAAGYVTQLGEKEAKLLLMMNRKERRAELSRLRRKGRLK